MIAESAPVNLPSFGSTTCTRLDLSVDMNKLCRQVSIESPGPLNKDCVFSFEVPVPECPSSGARIRVVCAGACYRPKRSPSVSSISSTSSQFSTEEAYAAYTTSPAHTGVRDASIFPGYEVAGVVDEIGATASGDIKVGQRVVIYPYEGCPHGYAEYMVVPDLKYLVPIPDGLDLSVAAMLPTGALLAKSAVATAHSYVKDLLRERPNQTCRILVVGTGGLALWAVRIAAHHFSAPECQELVHITVASLKDDGFVLAKEFEKCDARVNVVQWSEDLYEKQLIERTKDACQGLVDIVIDFGTTSRSLHRSLQCLNTGGIVLVSEEVADRLLPKFSRLAVERQQYIKGVKNGSIEQLRQLVKYVSTGEIVPPPHSVYPAEEAPEVVRKLCQSEILGRAILRFHDIQ